MSDKHEIDKLLEELFPEGVEAAFADLEQSGSKPELPAAPQTQTPDALQPDGEPKAPVAPRPAGERKAPIAPRPAGERSAPAAQQPAGVPAAPIVPPAPQPTRQPEAPPAPELADVPDAPAAPKPAAAPVEPKPVPAAPPVAESVKPAPAEPAVQPEPEVPAAPPAPEAQKPRRGILPVGGRRSGKNGKKPGEKLDEFVRMQDERQLGHELEERDFRPIRQRRDSRTGLLGGLMYAAFVICVSIILACGAWMAASDVLALNKEYVSAQVTLSDDLFHDKQIDVYDEDGNVTGTKTVPAADMGRVATLLRDAGVIEYKQLFALYAGISDADIKIDPGTYELTTDYDYRALVKKMTIGSEAMLTTKITFPEGLSVEQIFRKLEENRICTVSDLRDAAANYNYSYSFLEDVPAQGDPLRLEGFLFPDTYEFYQGEQASSAINRFLRTFHYKLTADMLTQAENLNLTMREAVTVAAMIEKEAANDEERPLIASVIYNRMRAGMPLQIDATVLYALGDWSAEINAEALAVSSPYNTYLFSGLPAGPICNPGMASLRAALQPADTNYIYYALDTASGTHRFFAGYDEFAAFTATQDYG